MKSPRRSQRGHMITEYVVVCGVLAFILFVPIADGASSGQSRTTVEIIIDGFTKAYKKFSFALSLPT
ncbi:hypothetical protein G4G28_09845 [Massilia sp. Dwa41.01b]|uniref:hypothetical protein n=1 Tax=unclassified Massilia TaxID=2609279 RepID=UPI001601A36B|nr:MULTISPECIES: hypothetical protein [unclassified Massilia]QNA87218.1 hypothetical protein G4G28_09845 [Massilia sp. Dwa41.01b]QNA97559.1 hypothetical protein G4G31_13520 [Massilia sp. Se16.2.3]